MAKNMWSTKHYTTISLVLMVLRGIHGTGASRSLVDVLARQAAESQSEWTCTNYTALFEPQYTNCSIEDNDQIAEVLQNSWPPYSLCLLLDGKPCRSYYICENGESAYVDCRNVYPDDPDLGISFDCDGNALPVSPTALAFEDGINGCSRVGWNCVGTYYDLASCYWYDFLGDGTRVTILTNEPSDSIGDPSDEDYYGECYAKVGGLSDNCNSCEISCMEENNNYASFDCSNLSTDPCAITENCYSCGSGESSSTPVTPLTPPTPNGTDPLHPDFSMAAPAAFNAASGLVVVGTILMALGL